MLWLSLCEYGPLEVRRLGPFTDIEIMPGSNFVGVRNTTENDEAEWVEVEIGIYHAVFVEDGPEPRREHV